MMPICYHHESKYSCQKWTEYCHTCITYVTEHTRNTCTLNYRWFCACEIWRNDLCWASRKPYYVNLKVEPHSAVVSTYGFWSSESLSSVDLVCTNLFKMKQVLLDISFLMKNFDTIVWQKKLVVLLVWPSSGSVQRPPALKTGTAAAWIQTKASQSRPVSFLEQEAHGCPGKPIRDGIKQAIFITIG